MRIDESVSETIKMENIWFSRVSSVARFVGQRLPEFADAIKRTTVNIIAELDELEKQSTMAESQSDNESCESDRISDLSEMNRPFVGERETLLDLPWELMIEEKSIIFRDDDELKTRILALSLKEESFVTPYSSDQKDHEGSSLVCNNSKLTLINRLYQHDANLALIHARLVEQNRVEDNIFWKNYFFHCNKLRDIRINEISGHDEELDVEIIQNPESSCMEFVIHPESYDYIQDEYVIIKQCG